MGPKTSDSSLILPGIESTNLPQVESNSSISRCDVTPRVRCQITLRMGGERGRRAGGKVDSDDILAWFTV